MKKKLSIKNQSVRNLQKIDFYKGFKKRGMLGIGKSWIIEQYRNMGVKNMKKSEYKDNIKVKKNKKLEGR